jgi:periplasmic divalent cation tolerance protein
MADKFIQVFTALPTKTATEKIAKILVQEKLAACVQILGPIESIYKWKGKLEKSKEWLCIIKAAENNFNKIEEKIKSVHSYEIPEIIAVPIIYGNRAYLEWMEKRS